MRLQAVRQKLQDSERETEVQLAALAKAVTTIRAGLAQLNEDLALVSCRITETRLQHS